MIELYTQQDIFEIPSGEANKNIVCITTNDVVKKNGETVMVAGIAKTANERFAETSSDSEPRSIAALLGKWIGMFGNYCMYIGSHRWKNSVFDLYSFPTKHQSTNSAIELPRTLACLSWKDKSDINLIRQSAKQMVRIADMSDAEHIYLVPPGCGLGGLDYQSEVRPVLKPILDDRFVIVIRK